MPSIPQIRNFNLKIIFIVHFVFIALSMIGAWTSFSFHFYNSILILLLLWSVYHDQSHEPIQLAIVVNGISIILDIILLIMRFPESHYASERFSAAMAILHLIFRPFSTILLIKNLEERSGSSGIIGPGPSSSYEDIDKTAPQSSGRTGGYDFASAEPI